MDGLYLGIRMTSGEKIVCNSNGLFKVRFIRRKIEAERWGTTQIGADDSSPWKPYHGSEDAEIMIRPPTAIIPKSLSEQPTEKSRIEDPTPRPFSIQRRDLVNLGYTPGCRAATPQPMTKDIVLKSVNAEEDLRRQ